jgi:hypothetical protein
MKRVEKIFDIEKVTKRFYDRFQKEHAIFMYSIQGLEERDKQQMGRQAWYTSIILNRLMFLYFLQKQGFLATTNPDAHDGDTHYLRTRLHMVQSIHDEQNMYYRYFLLPLFHHAERTPEMEHLLGRLPYLHHELFSVHELEQKDCTIEIPDAAFERIFTFFDEFQWILAQRSLRHEREVNPDVLGYVFEKHINQQQMGAYYTQDDVTTYIAQNSILPALLDAIERVHPEVFGKQGIIWKLLQQDPERYMQDAIYDEKYLPTETEREYGERRAYYQRTREQIEQGKMCTSDDFITHNLALDLFIQDVLHHIDEPKVLDAFIHCLTQITILDPTCGSGAFLSAALRVLMPLYETLRARFSAPTVRAAFTTPSAILKSIISTNLYGVDIMEEAVELCKLRLFLLLASALEDNENIKSLVEVDFHICAGNALVGFAQSTELVGRDASWPPPWLEADHRSLTRTQASSRPYPHTQQAAAMIRSRVDWELAREYGIDAGNSAKFEQWRESHKPFHWSYEFAEVRDKGGFDCIIGNPPYVEYVKERFSYQLQDFATLACGNLYPCVIERSRTLLAAHGRLGMIVPLAAFATRNMTPLIDGVLQWFAQSWISFYHFRPAMLFSGGKVASIPTAILLTRIDGQEQRFSTSINRWATENRKLLFPTLKYGQITVARDPTNRHYYAKFTQVCENAIMEKVLRQRCVGDYLAQESNENKMYYRSAGGLYWKIFLNFPWPYQTTSNKQCMFAKGYERDVFVALFNSSLFWWYYSVTFDTFNVKDYMLFAFRFTYPENETLVSTLSGQCKRLMEDFRVNAKHLKRGETGSYTIFARKSKQILDEIDGILAQHYGLSAEELDFILHYDIKYRMGPGVS